MNIKTIWIGIFICLSYSINSKEVVVREILKIEIAKTSNTEIKDFVKKFNRDQLEAYIFLQKHRREAIRHQIKYGIPASIKLAQALLESQKGQSKMAKNIFNYFGVKCFSKNCSKWHCTNFADDEPTDRFKNYRSVSHSFEDHSELLTTNRYKPLQKCGNDYKKWAKGLQDLGYATDPKYANKLITIIEFYHL